LIGAQGRVPVFAYRRPVDLRKGFEGLSALVQQALGRDPLSGALYLFTNRRRTTAKVLQFDGTGLTISVRPGTPRCVTEGRRCWPPDPGPRPGFWAMARMSIWSPTPADPGICGRR
jgi:hypothetical protein